MRLLNRLWVRLSLYISLFIFLGVLMVAVVPRLLLTYNGLDVSLQLRNRLIENLSVLYAENGNWDGVADRLRSYDLMIPRGFGGEPTALIFADADGHLLYDGTGQHQSAMLTEDERANAGQIIIDGVLRAYLMEKNIKFTAPAGSDPNFFLREILNGLVLFAIIIGVIGVIAGVLISRQLTAPLSDLAKSVRLFRNPNLNKRALVRGTVEVREVATAFNEMAEAIAEAETLRRNLVSDVAHELRTPLTVLQANIQAILDDLYPLNKTEIQNLQAQTDLLQRLVNDLHELAQAEAHQLQLHMMSVNMNSLVQNLVDHFSAVTQSKDVSLRTEFASASIRVNADPDRIAQVLQNLIHNAITHTPEGGVITVGLSTDLHNVLLSVKDTGAGISSQDQMRIFERFYRTDEARSRATGGAGLGLPIAKAIIDMHNGTIQVNSDGIAGHGTTFTITLPNTQTAAMPPIPDPADKDMASV